ncbi:MAG: hypothetical protein WCT14_12205 [Treponemataceae bacterium]
MKKTRVIFMFGVCASVVFASCASVLPKVPLPMVQSKKPAPTAPAPAPAPAPAAPATAPERKPAAVSDLSKDYLGENLKLVGIGDDLDGPYSVRFYTAEVLTPPSPSTKNEGLVRPTGKVRDTTETQFWTPYIASSRPATKDELKPGMLVFGWGETQRRSRDELAKVTLWHLFRVKDISNLYKETVILTYHATYGSSHWKDYEYRWDNIRVVVGDIPSLDLVELPK